ncbi:hypothetical protein K3495_g5433 [Podosphaera aphanis]|nr:hypothetical protein K3495_g5433 [Podosphaera aphanis]
MSGPPGSGPTEDGDSAGMDTLLAQLRQHSKPVNLEPSYRYYNERPSFYNQPQSQLSSHSLFLQTDSKVSDATSSNHNSAGSQPHDTSRPKSGASAAPNGDRTSSLLNLLKFSQPSAISAATTTPTLTAQTRSISRETSASHPGPDGQAQAHSQSRHESDLLASLMSSSQTKPTQQVSLQLPKSSIDQSSLVQANASPPIDTQAYLLQLLNQPKSDISSSPPLKQVIKPHTLPNNHSTETTAGIIVQKTREVPLETDRKILDASKMHQANDKDLSEGSVKEPAATKKNSGIFTYVNPFDGLAASSPRNRGPKNEKPVPFKPTIQILKNPREDLSDKTLTGASSIPSPHNKQKANIVSDKSGLSSPFTNGFTKSGGLAHPENSKRKHPSQEKPCKDMDKQPNNFHIKTKMNTSSTRIENQLRDMLAAKSEKDAANFSMENDKGKETQKSSAHSQVAEHWESVDAENSLKENNDTITVYNFPMRPWSSITLKSTEYRRPFFREQAFSEIARLKRDFDQIDRNLVTASPNCIAYCMSKNGGIRIIRQSDGRDAKVFTETQDRVFNVIISTSPYEKEAIIGTGISGKVYWTLIKDNDGDHLEENHLQSFGFILPPLPEPDSEMVGGVLKTRARKSSNHPEFFAVARGKCIFIILPELILKEDFLKDGEKRFVDIDRYLGHRSLKINTGKSGKDLTFSDDDTVIVSLDKSGQIKFWDIRSLTGPDALNTSTASLVREVQHPILVLNSLPPNEKSSATSVLFVDKLRPYLRGGPLRYLILGLKQNHTLQLWDIALRKPVQVINLPHSNDSDPICSVTYHASTGMIMVGHPTRNSIYFFHFSAPKYNLTKSLSQAEYMEHIAAGKTLPKPESTAAISDMREFSLDNKGTLRSLDILQNHNLTSANLPNPADFLFELYCMHSKGVTCIPIHQRDLGWDSENKVVNSVLAEDLDIIKFDSLKENHPVTIPEDLRSTLPSLAPSRIIPITAQIESIKSKDTLEVNQSSGEKIDRKDYSSQTPAISGTNHLTAELERSILSGISHALAQPHLTTLMSEGLAPPVVSKIMKEINGFVTNNILPVVSDMLAQNALKITSEIQRRTSEQINVLEQRHISDSNKITQLTKLVSGLSDNLSSVSEAVTSMATAQAEFQAKFLEMQQQAAQDRSHHNQKSEDLKNHHISRPPSALTDPVKSREEEEYENMMNGISAAINAGDYENAVILWLQTQREQEFFMNYFAKFSPDFVRELSPLLLLSLGATISVEFEGDVNNSFLNQRIAWLEMILSTFQAHISAGSMDDQVRNLSPKIMGIYRQRFEHLYMRISQVSPHEPILKRLSFLVAAADRIVETAQVSERLHDYGAGLGGGKNGGRHGLRIN